MAGITNNLYPPIVSTYMPAFVRTSNCRVYFSLSDYNDVSEIANVQVSIANQNSTLSALDSSKYPSGIMVTNLQINTDIKNDEKYFIEISPKVLKNADADSPAFEIGQYYKIQLRFTSTAASVLPSNSENDEISGTYGTNLASWLVENQSYFSEWSTVCLIKGIEQPQIYLKNFTDDDILNSTEKTFTSQIVDIVGGLYYEANESLEDEYLKYYIINIYDSNEELYYTSDIVYTNEFYPNEINYTLKTNLEEGSNYTLELIYVTNNEYTNSVSYTFNILNTGIETLDATISAEADNENGRIIISIVGQETSTFLGNLCIRRSSSETNFSIWEDIKIETIVEGQALNYTWYDYTAQSGVYYNYCAQKIDTKGNRGVIITIKTPIMLYLDHVFLTQGDFQLKIKYDPSITEFKTSYVESKTETLGSKYPYITRNGNTAYKNFSISGLITAFCDEDNIFTSREGFYGDNLADYDDFNEDEQITPYKDFIYEKFFRDKVMDFLYKNDVKLFRSLTEGNILVRLMDVSFTPNETLGRMLYSFTATACEIDECSIDNYNKYGIISIGEYSNIIEYDYTITGQINEAVAANKDVISLLQTKYEDTNIESGYYNNINYLTWLRLDFQSDPYLIQCNSDGSLSLATAGVVNENTVYGYIAYINGQSILISSRGYYELNDDNTVITSLSFPVETEVAIDYTVNIDRIQDNSIIVSKYTNYLKVGQLWGIFDVNDSIYKQIYLKYYYKYSDYYISLLSIDKLRIEADAGTIVYVKDSFDDIWYAHEIGSTQTLLFNDEDTTIEGLYFYGVHLYPMKDETRLEPEDTEYKETNISAAAEDEIDNPVKNGVYTIDNERYIYYHNQWYEFTSDDIVLCPVVGLVDYIVEIVKGEY